MDETRDELIGNYVGQQIAFAHPTHGLGIARHHHPSAVDTIGRDVRNVGHHNGVRRTELHRVGTIGPKHPRRIRSRETNRIGRKEIVVFPIVVRARKGH